MSGLSQTLLRPLLVANALLVLAALCMGALHPAVVRGWARPRGAVRGLRLTVVLALALPFALVLFQGALPVRVQALVVAAGADAQATLATALPALLRTGDGGSLPWRVAAEAAVLFGLALALWRGMGYARLVVRIRERPLFRRIGRVELRLAEAGCVPASVRLPLRAVVLLPEPLLLSPGDLRIALAHELEHHRRGDAAWALVATLLRALFFWNPALRLLSRLADGWQELACDDALIFHRGVSRNAYAACLVRSAERALRPHLSPAAVGMAVHRGTTLRRRVERMFTHRNEKSWAVTLATGIAVLGLGTSALAVGTGSNRSGGELSKDAIRQTIRAHISEVKGCYERALEAAPGLHGKLVVQFVIGVTGSVRSADIATLELTGPAPTSTTPAPGAKAASDRVASCITSAVKTWTFPAPRGGEVSVSYPFAFGAR